MRNGRAIAARSSQTEEIVSIVSSDPLLLFVPAQADHRQGRVASRGNAGDGRSRRLTMPRYRGKAKVDLQNQFIGAT